MVRVHALSRRQKILAVVVVVVALLAGVGVVAWMKVAATTADQVVVTWDLRCPPGTDGRSHRGPAIKSRPGWRCDVDVHVANTSDRDVRVTGIESAVLGPGGGAEIEGRSTDDAEVSGDGPDGIDGRWEVDVPVPAGETRSVTIAVGWRARGCNSAGWLFLEDWPRVDVEVLHRTYSRHGDQSMLLRTFDDRHDQGRCVT